MGHFQQLANSRSFMLRGHRVAVPGNALVAANRGACQTEKKAERQNLCSRIVHLWAPKDAVPFDRPRSFQICVVAIVLKSAILPELPATRKLPTASKIDFAPAADPLKLILA